MSDNKIFTIGFTKTLAETFFSKLNQAGVRTVIDVRLNNTSQLSGFAKRDDLIYFLREICGSSYRHMPAFAPTKDILEAYKKKQLSWAEYERQFVQLIRDRGIERLISRDELMGACFLCSEPTAANCHRRLVAEYLNHEIGGFDIIHL